MSKPPKLKHRNNIIATLIDGRSFGIALQPLLPSSLFLLVLAEYLPLSELSGPSRPRVYFLPENLNFLTVHG